jgi:hypothetical protein
MHSSESHGVMYCLKVLPPLLRSSAFSEEDGYVGGWVGAWRNGRAIAQAVSRWLSTAAAWVGGQVRSCGICGGQSGTGTGFLRVLLFPHANLHSTNCSAVSIILSCGASTIGQ